MIHGHPHYNLFEEPEKNASRVMVLGLDFDSAAGSCLVHGEIWLAAWSLLERLIPVDTAARCLTACRTLASQYDRAR